MCANAGSGLPIHSLTEARLYFRVSPCPHCTEGPLVPDPSRSGHDDSVCELTVPAACRACGRTMTVCFDTSQLRDRDRIPDAPYELLVPAEVDRGEAINPTDEPSRAIDLAGWVTLHNLIVESIRPLGTAPPSLTDREIARSRLIEAGRCLDEALKFFDADNDLPPEDAFFHTESQRRFREHPELFTRERLINLRRALPR